MTVRTLSPAEHCGRVFRRLRQVVILRAQLTEAEAELRRLVGGETMVRQLEALLSLPGKVCEACDLVVNIWDECCPRCLAAAPA